MDIQILASSSEGNCYIISDSKTRIMIDCGIPMQDILRKTNFLEEKIDGCLISHEHKDHSSSALELMKRGITCYMSIHVANLFKSDADVLTSRGVIIEDKKEFDIGTFKIRPMEMNHDVPCFGFLIYSSVLRESLFFATDTSYIRYMIPPVNYIMVEANYDLEILNRRIQAGDTDMVAKDRLVKSHMSIAATLSWLTSTNLSKCKRIYLMHLSAGSSNEEDFKRRVIEATGIPTTVCKA